MKRKQQIVKILGGCILGLLPLLSVAEEGNASIAAAAANSALFIPSAPKIAGTSYLLEDFNSGQALVEKDADARVAPASLTKVMTVYVVFSELKKGSLKLSDLVTISTNAQKQEGSRMFLEANQQVSVEDLIQGVVIQSGNDASVALAEHVASSDSTFASLMNQQAARLGMTGTHFTNSMGLPDPEHYSTARDLAKLARAVIRDFPEYYRWDAQKEFTFNKITQPNRNLLLWRDPSVDGIKTGHTEEAGYCMMASAKRNEMRLISIVMGTKSMVARANESQTLLNYGFKFYETRKLYPAKQVLGEASVLKGEVSKVPLGFLEDFYVTVPVGHFNDLKAAVTVGEKIIAPVAEGSSLGKVVFTLGGQPFLQHPMRALKTVNVGNMLQRFYGQIMMMVNKND